MSIVLTLLVALLALILLRPATAIGNCCCGAGGGGGAVCCVVCRLFSTLAREYTMTVAGITSDVFCSNCERLNGSFTLRWHDAGSGASQGENCLWGDYSTLTAACQNVIHDSCAAYRQWQLGVVETSPDVFAFRLLPQFGPSLYYQRAAADWNCTGSNVMTLVGDPAVDACDNYPATITLTAGSGRVGECNCYPPFDAYATIWQLSFQNIKGCCSPEINDTFTLPFSPLPTAEHCVWFEDVVSDCNSGLIVMSLELARSVLLLYIMSASSGGCLHAYYQMKMADFNPLGANTLTRYDVDCVNIGFCGECSGWPATIQIVPA